MDPANHFEFVMLLALQGTEPDDDDLSTVKPTPGSIPDTFKSELATTAQKVLGLRNQGNFAAARTVAIEASASYLAPFLTLLPPPFEVSAEDVRSTGARMFGDQASAETNDATNRMFGG